jgi:hypothetical protein
MPNHYRDYRKASAKKQLGHLAEASQRKAPNRNRRARMWARVDDLVAAGFSRKDALHALEMDTP